MEGEGEVKGDTGMEIGSETNRKECTFHTSHRRCTDWLHSSTGVAASSRSMLRKQPFFSSFWKCHFPDGPTLLLLPPGYQKAVQTQPVSPGLPLGARSDLYSLGFFPLPILLYLFTAGCLFFYWLFYKGDEWALSRPCWALYIETLSHTHILSLSVLCVGVRFEELCVSFGYDWWRCLWTPRRSISPRTPGHSSSAWEDHHFKLSFGDRNVQKPFTSQLTCHYLN